MAITLYNTLTRKKEEFHPIQEEKAGIYACGPTVYWFAHIGNLRSFILADLLNRVLAYNGFDTTLIMNITDVGHLVGDEDEGEDKMIVAMKREGKNAYDIAAFYTEAFLKDIDRLNIERADEYPKATEHIEEQIAMVKKLEDNGFTYTTSDGVYMDTSTLNDYGRLSGQSAEEKQAGVRVEMGEKKHATDFALWKFSPKDQQRDMEWDSPWGKGFPGWHIECSAMSTKYLGLPFDIHTGGVDHIPVHHENELAQTEGAEGKLQAKTWLHGEFLTVDGGKMSKSLGNLYTLDQLEEKGFDPLAYRYFCLQAHYRTKLNFTFEALEAAQNALNRLRATTRNWDTPSGGCADFHARFLQAVNDDLDLPKALAIVWELVDSEYDSSAKAGSLLHFDQILGLGLETYVGKPIEAPEEVMKLVEEREEARKEKDFETSDRLRDEIAGMGYTIEDTAEGPELTEKR